MGVPIDALTMGEAMAIIDREIRFRRRLLICVVNVAKMVNMRRDQRLRDAVLSANMILADGMGVVWACRLLGRRLPERVAGIDLMLELLSASEQKGYRLYFLGATREVVDQAVENMRRLYPRAVVAGYQHGYFTAEEESTVAETVRNSRADVLLVGMTSPKKEEFLARWVDYMAVPVCHGVGGAFDVLAGKVKRAPLAWQRLGLEWLYRVVQEPRRMWRRYLVTNLVFCWLVLAEWLGLLRRPTAPR